MATKTAMHTMIIGVSISSQVMLLPLLLIRLNCDNPAKSDQEGSEKELALVLPVMQETLLGRESLLVPGYLVKKIRGVVR